MEVRRLLLCDFAQVGEKGKYTVVGIFDMWRQPTVPALLPPFKVLAYVAAAPGEVSPGIESLVEFRFRRCRDDAEVLKFGGPVRWNEMDAWSVEHGANLDASVNALRVEEFGQYAVDVLVEGRQLGSAPFWVLQEPEH